MFISMLAAFAAPNAPDSLVDYWSSVKELRLHSDLYRRVEKPIKIRDGAMTVTISEGYLIPIFSGRFGGEWSSRGPALLRKLRQQDKDAELPAEADRGTKDFVGFIWTKGKGQVDTKLQDRGDAVRLANFMVHRLGEEPSKWKEVPSAKAFSVGADEGMFLSIDPRLEKRFLAQGGSVSDDPYEVIVYEDDKPGPALARAESLFKSRVKVQGGESLTERIAWDRTAEERGVGDASGDLMIFDVHTDQRYGRVNMQKSGSPAGDEWLTNLRDNSGALGRWKSIVHSSGMSAGGAIKSGRISGTPFPPISDDPASIRQPSKRIEPVFATATVWAQPDSGLVDVRFETELTFKAVGGAAQWVELRVPRNEARANSFEVISAVDADGVDLLTSDREFARVSMVEIDPDEVLDDPEEDEDRFGEAREDERDWRSAPDPTDGPRAEFKLFLPQTVADGEEFVVRLQWKDTWPLNNHQACSSSIVRPLGASSGLQDFLPASTSGRLGTPWKFKARIGVPEKSKLSTAMSGKTTASEVEGGWRWTWSEQTKTDALFPGVAVGKWQSHEDPAQKGFPAVKTHLLQAFPGQLEAFGPEARRVIDYYQRWMPDYPVPELEVFEGPGACYGYTWVAPHGMVNVQRMVTGGEVGVRNEKHLEHAVFSHEVAHQYWGHLAPPASIEDFWIAETFSEGFACMYVGAAFKPKECTQKMESARKYWERDIQVWGGVGSLTDAYSSGERGQIVYQ